MFQHSAGTDFCIFFRVLCLITIYRKYNFEFCSATVLFLSDLQISSYTMLAYCTWFALRISHIKLIFYIKTSYRNGMLSNYFIFIYLSVAYLQYLLPGNTALKTVWKYWKKRPFEKCFCSLSHLTLAKSDFTDNLWDAVEQEALIMVVWAMFLAPCWTYELLKAKPSTSKSHSQISSKLTTSLIHRGAFFFSLFFLGGGGA